MEQTADSVVAGQDSGAETTPRPTSNNNKKPLVQGFMSYGNGAPKRHYPTAPAVSYKECMRNHAASMGGHALDGCCEFMASPATYKADDPSSLRCAACGCHRNFHRRDPDDPAPLHRQRPTQMPMTPLGFPGSGRKRFRTRFSEEQKDKMRGFAERFGWKMQKIDKAVVEEFCKEVGVAREVLKVWMHNHKAGDQGAAAGAGAGGAPHNNNHTHNNHHHNGGVAGGGQFDHDVVVSSGDGSSSSSSSGFSI